MSLIRRRAGTAHIARPIKVATPSTPDDVVREIRAAWDQGLAVVVRGGGSGVCGAADTVEGCVLLDMTGLDRIGEIDTRAMTVHVQAGVKGPALEDALNRQGLTLGYFPQSFELATVGGWIATKGIGQLSTKYGGIEDRLIGLTAVLADGTMVSSRPSPRSSAGADWWRLLVGSEGTLGVVVDATLSAFRIPAAHSWVCCAPQSFEQGLELSRELVQAGLRPSVARLYDPADASVSFPSLGIDGCVLILRFEGETWQVEAEKAEASRIIGSVGAQLVDDEAAGHWWSHRFRGGDTYKRILSREGPLGPYGVVDTMEVSAFWPSLPGLYRRVGGEVGRFADMVLAHTSHLYTSGANIYFTFLISSASNDDEAETKYQSAWESGMKATLESGGSISHHHGIGLLKAPWLGAELGSGFDALRRIKTSLDPKGTMNPGKQGLP